MATIALQAVGTAIGGPFGGMVGAVIGGVIDQALFGPGDQSGPRLTDLKVTTSTYGTQIPLLYGPENRVAGNIIWSTDKQEREVETEAGKGGPTITQFEYSISCAIAISGRQLSQLKRIWANNKVIFDIDGVNQFSPPHEIPAVDDTNGQIITKYFTNEFGQEVFRGTHTVMDEVRFYTGSATQIPDSLIESHEGVGNVSGYRHTSYVVLKELILNDWGGNVPNLEFEGVADDSITAGAVVKDFTDRASISNVSVFGLNDAVRGYVLARQSTVANAITPLAVAYNFEASDQGGQIRFVRKSRGMKGSILLTEMNARDGKLTSLTNKTPIQYTNLNEIEMPDEVTISFRDPDVDYQTNTQRARRRKGNAKNKITQEIPLVLSATEAIRIAERLLWGAWSNKRSAQFTVNDEWMRINAGDLLGIPAFGETLPMKVFNQTRGDNGVISMEAVYEDPEIYNSQSAGIDALAFSQTVSLPGDTLWVPLDAPLLRDTDPDSGFYWAATAENSGWRGATIKRSTDSGISYDKVSDVTIRNPVGTISGILGSGPSEIFDRSNSITVTLTSSKNSLESISELLVLNGHNAAWVGPADGGVGEILQFATATLISGQTYTLSNFLRGRLGTEHMINNHGAGEVFVLLQKGSLGTSDFGIGDWDILRLYKPISFLTDETIVSSQEFVNTGVRSKPLSPAHVKGTRDTSNSLTITWLRRTRKRVPGLGKGEVPLGETTEAYEIDIVTETAVLRTITATSETASYTAAQQTEDGLTPGELVMLDVYQLSETRGRGYAARAIL